MPIPDYGALPLAKTFLMVRGLSLVSMVGIVGMTANFVSEIVSTGVSPPREIVGTLSVVSPLSLDHPVIDHATNDRGRPRLQLSTV